MGRLLDLARQALELPPEPPLSPVPDIAPESPIVAFAPDDLVSDLLACLNASVHPVPHSLLLREMQKAGYSKDAARSMIRELQHSGQIEHDLKHGYVLASERS